MKGKLIRLILMIAITVIFSFLGNIFKVNPLFFLAPAILALLNTIIWDLLKFDIFDKGFFRFIKFVGIIAVFIILLTTVMKESMALINEELFDINNPMTDLQICLNCGAVGILAATYCLCLGIPESFGDRNIGLFIPFIAVLIGALFGFICYIGGAISVGFSKVLVWLPIVFALFLTFGHIKEYGLLYEDLPMGAGFRGFGSGSKKGRFEKTGRPIEDAMNLIAWNESKQISLSYNNAINIEVDVTVYSYTIEFEISGRVYINNSEMNANQATSVNQEINNIIANTQSRILNRAQRDLNSVLHKNPELDCSFNINVKIGYIDCI